MNEENKYCVYLHLDETGVVRFVGEGTLTRAFNTNRKDQKNYKEYFKDKKVSVEIVDQNLTKTQAEDLYQDLKLKHKDTIINSKTSTKKMKTLDYFEISKYLFYDETSSTFLRWKDNEYTGVGCGRIPNAEAGGKEHNTGYRYIYINNVEYSVHRVVWVLLNKELPSGKYIDHIDGDRLNNNILNLRLADSSLNAKNKRNRVPKSTGVRNLNILKYKGQPTSCVVRWAENGKRKNRCFNVSVFGDFDLTFKAAYLFRKNLIDSGVLFIASGIEDETAPNITKEDLSMIRRLNG